ncbi:MAG: FHA domain-containing protein [Myxococcota bacterium]
MPSPSIARIRRAPALTVLPDEPTEVDDGPTALDGTEWIPELDEPTDARTTRRFSRQVHEDDDTDEQRTMSSAVADDATEAFTQAGPTVVGALRPKAPPAKTPPKPAAKPASKAAPVVPPPLAVEEVGGDTDVLLAETRGPRPALREAATPVSPPRTEGPRTRRREPPPEKAKARAEAVVPPPLVHPDDDGTQWDQASNTRWVRDRRAPPSPASESPTVIRPSAERAEAAPVASPVARSTGWVVRSGQRAWPVPSGRPMVLGRSSTCDARIDGDYVSRQHVELRVDGRGALVIRGLNPKNATLVDRRPLDGEVRLEAREAAWTLVLGDSEVLVAWSPVVR